MEIPHSSEQMTEEKYQLIKKNYGRIASWAVWADRNGPPKSEIGNVDLLNVSKSPSILTKVKPEYVLLGLNGSVYPDEKSNYFQNFHSAWSRAQDYKLREALHGTCLWGAYFTDIIKDYPERRAAKVIQGLRANPEIEKENIARFKEEINFVCGGMPKIVLAFGNAAFSVLERNKDYIYPQMKIAKVTHYSHAIKKGALGLEIKQVIKDFSLD